MHHASTRTRTPARPVPGRAILFAAAALAVLLPSAAWAQTWQTRCVPFGDMLPTVEVGECFLAADVHGPGTTPARPGDVVLYKVPGQPGQEFVKRVIAVGGDRVQMRAGILLINGVPVERERLPDPAPIGIGPGAPVPAQAWRETLPNGRSYLTYALDGSRSGRDTPETRVPPGHVFVLGDNRDNSMDSRFADHGPVPDADLEGRATLVFRSPDAGRIGTPLTPGPAP